MYKLSDYHYNLPPEKIAQTPITPAHNSRLLYCTIQGEKVSYKDHITKDIQQLLKPQTLLIANNSQVFASRLKLSHKKVTLNNGEETILEDGEILIVRVLFTDKNTINENQCIIR